jgi:hypothetical protein
MKLDSPLTIEVTHFIHIIKRFRRPVIWSSRKSSKRFPVVTDPCHFRKRKRATQRSFSYENPILRTGRPCLFYHAFRDLSGRSSATSDMRWTKSANAEKQHPRRCRRCFQARPNYSCLLRGGAIRARNSSESSISDASSERLRHGNCSWHLANFLEFRLEVGCSRQGRKIRWRPDLPREIYRSRGQPWLVSGCSQPSVGRTRCEVRRLHPLTL